MTNPATVTVATASAAWHHAEKVRAPHRWLLKVSSELRDKSEAMLPRHPGEKANAQGDPWSNRVARTLLWPYFPMALWSFVGRVISKDFQYDVGDDAEMRAIYTDIDKAGRDLSVFAQPVFFDMWCQGAPFVLIESAERGGTTPKWILFESHQIIVLDWGINAQGQRVPKRVHIKDETPEAWGSKSEPRVRVLLGDGEGSRLHDGAAGPGAGLGSQGARFEFYRQDPNDNMKWVPSPHPKEQPGRFAHDEIPGYLFDFGRLESGAVIPASEWLGELCRAYYREGSDHGTMIYMLRAVILAVSGMTKEEFIANGQTSAGPMSVFFLNKDASMQAVETTGAAGELSFRDLERYLTAIRLASLTPIDPDKVQTLGEVLITGQYAGATLAASAKRFKDGLEQLMRITAAQIGRGPEAAGSVAVPVDFRFTEAEERTVKLLADLRKGYGEGPEISRAALWRVLKEVVPDLADHDPEADDENLTKERDEADERAKKRVAAFAGGDPLGE